jgi:competence protein ComEC
MLNFKRKLAIYLVFALIGFSVLIWQNIYAEKAGLLEIALLDVGQGDAIYVESPSGPQMLVDGGPRGQILEQLAGVMPFQDRTIDVIVITNPDADHIGGFLDVLKNYEVGKVIEPGTQSSSKTYAELEKMISDKKIEKLIARQGMSVDLGSGVHFDILFPDRDVSSWDRNDGSVVGRLVYRGISGILTGDATKKTESLVIESFGGLIRSDFLKVGHHGSYTSTGENFVKAVSPAFALISSGRNNRYGHPHEETLATLKKIGANILRTDELGTIILLSDGVKIWRK